MLTKDANDKGERYELCTKSLSTIKRSCLARLVGPECSRKRNQNPKSACGLKY